MKELVNAIVAEYEVFAANAAAQAEKGNKAAGARARKSSLALEKMMKEFLSISKIFLWNSTISFALSAQRRSVFLSMV
jgi:hypothetical protein